MERLDEDYSNSYMVFTEMYFMDNGYRGDNNNDSSCSISNYPTRIIHGKDVNFVDYSHEVSDNENSIQELENDQE